MPNLREMIDGHGSLQINAFPERKTAVFKVQDDFVMRRKINRSGPSTNEVVVGKILAMNDDGTAEVSLQKTGGMTQRATVSVSDLSPVTEKFRRQSLQFSTQFRPRA